MLNRYNQPCICLCRSFISVDKTKFKLIGVKTHNCTLNLAISSYFDQNESYLLYFTTNTWYNIIRIIIIIIIINIIIIIYSSLRCRRIKYNTMNKYKGIASI